MKDVFAPIIDIAIQAGDEILEVYGAGKVGVETKSDSSPITIADKRAHKVIVNGLANLDVKYPTLSEESAEATFAERKSWDSYWMVDPLDGTKEFINRTDEFTVNIALIRGSRACLGVVYIPVTGEIFFGGDDVGAYRSHKESRDPQTIQVQPSQNKPRCLVSRSHAQHEQEGILKIWPDAEIVPAGSSLKFCRIAEGKADIYFRRGPTMEWDTAAGQCILEAAHGTMHRLDGACFTYHKEELLNPGFVALSRTDWNWQELLGD